MSLTGGKRCIECSDALMRIWGDDEGQLRLSDTRLDSIGQGGRGGKTTKAPPKVNVADQIVDRTNEKQNKNQLEASEEGTQRVVGTTW